MDWEITLVFLGERVKKKVLFIFGTRPEAIKMCPLALEMKKDSAFHVALCVTGQHREMLDQVLSFFELKPDYDLSLMTPGQSLTGFTSACLTALSPVFQDFLPDLVLVQGDTASAFCGALAAFYHKVPTGHIEAGLRTHDIDSPFPEEGMRQLIGRLARFHFCPTQLNATNLQREAITSSVHVVGNTVIDALFEGLRLLKKRGDAHYYERFARLDFTKKIVLVTAHRRENHGPPLRRINSAIRELADQVQDCCFFFAVHPNPAVKKVVEEQLSGHERIVLDKPLNYDELIWLMNKSYFILTDSGGLQEEAPSLGKPVLVLRESTERPEGVEAGTNKLIGTSKDRIIEESFKLFRDVTLYSSYASKQNPYGDGTACRQITSLLKHSFENIPN